MSQTLYFSSYSFSPFPSFLHCRNSEYNGTNARSACVGKQPLNKFVQWIIFTHAPKQMPGIWVLKIYILRPCVYMLTPNSEETGGHERSDICRYIDTNFFVLGGTAFWTAVVASCSYICIKRPWRQFLLLF